MKPMQTHQMRTHLKRQLYEGADVSDEELRRHFTHDMLLEMVRHFLDRADAHRIAASIYALDVDRLARRAGSLMNPLTHPEYFTLQRRIAATENRCRCAMTYVQRGQRVARLLDDDTCRHALEYIVTGDELVMGLRHIRQTLERGRLAVHDHAEDIASRRVAGQFMPGWRRLAVAR